MSNDSSGPYNVAQDSYRGFKLERVARNILTANNPGRGLVRVSNDDFVLVGLRGHSNPTASGGHKAEWD
ncbi:hypothetical protein AAE478_001154 [Parahypoxylon ruwenzoriense]